MRSSHAEDPAHTTSTIAHSRTKKNVPTPIRKKYLRGGLLGSCSSDSGGASSGILMERSRLPGSSLLPPPAKDPVPRLLLVCASCRASRRTFRSLAVGAESPGYAERQHPTQGPVVPFDIAARASRDSRSQSPA